MASKLIKNVVFDVGNVMVRWAPHEIARLALGDDKYTEQWAHALFDSDTWVKLDKGFLSEAEAKLEYQSNLGLTPLECDRLFYYVKHT